MPSDVNFPIDSSIAIFSRFTRLPAVCGVCQSAFLIFAQCAFFEALVEQQRVECDLLRVIFGMEAMWVGLNRV